MFKWKKGKSISDIVKESEIEPISLKENKKFNFSSYFINILNLTEIHIKLLEDINYKKLQDSLIISDMDIWPSSVQIDQFINNVEELKSKGNLFRNSISGSLERYLARECEFTDEQQIIFYRINEAIKKLDDHDNKLNNLKEVLWTNKMNVLFVKRI